MRDGEAAGQPGKAEFEKLESVLGSSVSVVVTNPNHDDNPIIYLNSTFEAMTGYARSAVIGRNCRFLQGEDTDPESVARLRDAIDAQEEVTVDILNYRADGSAFWNRLSLSPLTDSDGKLIYYIGVQHYLGTGDKPKSDARQQALDALGELQHRVKNHLAMIVGMIRLQAREKTVEANFDTLSRRIETLQLLYEEMTSRGDSEADVALGAYVSRIASAIGHLDGRPGIRIDIETVACQTDPDRATRIGFLVSETLTNALQHAFEGRDTGQVSLRMQMLADDRVSITVEDDGVGMPGDLDWPNGGGLGSRIVRQVADGLEATVDVTPSDNGGTLIRMEVDLRP